MSILRRWLGLSPIEIADEADPEEDGRRTMTAAVLERERQELRQKLQRQQSASRMMMTNAAAIRLMTRNDNEDR